MGTLRRRGSSRWNGSSLCLLAIVGGSFASSGCGGGGSARGHAVVQALQAVSQSGRSLPGFPPTGKERTQLQSLYQTSGFTPLWLAASGRLRGVGREALNRLRGAEAEGLRPEDYAATELDSLSRQVARKPVDPAIVARFDAGLTLCTLRYLRHIHAGRVDPRTVGLAIDPPSERHDYGTLLREALQDGSLDKVVSRLAPPLTQYRQVREALARYRALQADSLAELTLALPVPLKPGASTAGLDLLARRLVLTGDLSKQAAKSAAYPRYEGVLPEAVSRFQGRHGLRADSVLDKETLEELNVPVSWRIHQLELSLERLRWLGDLDPAPFVLVNIPMFELTAWNSPQATGQPSFRTGVIVGKALNTQTPVFVEEMRYIIFRPYWNIPPGILSSETLPAIERNKEFLRKNHMEIVEGQGDDADPIKPSGKTVDRLERGELRIRQRPGPGNALGPVKFVFPNDQNVYLHGTPAEELFDRSRRDFSHGCVRVEDTAGLAAWVLSDQPEWSRDRILEAMNDEARVSRRVSLLKPLTVVLFYATASVEPDGTVRFARDIYRHDRRLDGALHQFGGS